MMEAERLCPALQCTRHLLLLPTASILCKNAANSSSVSFIRSSLVISMKSIDSHCSGGCSDDNDSLARLGSSVAAGRHGSCQKSYGRLCQIGGDGCEWCIGG